jgi:hypothetical protein
MVFADAVVLLLPLLQEGPVRLGAGIVIKGDVTLESSKLCTYA